MTLKKEERSYQMKELNEVIVYDVSEDFEVIKGKSLLSVILSWFRRP